MTKELIDPDGNSRLKTLAEIQVVGLHGIVPERGDKFAGINNSPTCRQLKQQK